MGKVSIQFGLETEIGIYRDSEEELDVVAESIALVRSATASGVSMRWDYECEDPHADMRGFRVRELRQDTDEVGYYTQDAEREMTFTEIKSDLVLGNGARFYNDHAHPEYCTPECRSAADLVVQDRAGERILMACAEHLSAERGVPVRLYKNNTDFQGHSYGCHENYLMSRSLPWEALAQGVQAFLVTRQIFAGAGKFGVEAEDKFLGPGFQIGQRSDFFSELQSVDTMQRRPLINTRDEPHANPAVYRRFHVILGDANMSPFATWLKVGVTALVLEAIAAVPRAGYPVLADPLGALPGISRDPAFQWAVELDGGGQSNAIEVQRNYLALVREHCDLELKEHQELVGEWERVLNDLETDVYRCRDRLDWVAKLMLIREFQEAQSIEDDSPWLRSLDLEYHRLDLQEGLYYGIEQSGAMARVPDEEAVRRAASEPPMDTRARVRGRCIARFPAAVESAQWDHVTLQAAKGPIKICLLNMFDPDRIREVGEMIEQASEPEDLRSIGIGDGT